MKLIVAALFTFLFASVLTPAEAFAQDDPECASVCECMGASSARASGGSAIGGTGVDETDGAEGGDREGGGEDDDPPADQDGGGDDDEGGDNDDGDEMDGHDDEMDEEDRAECMANCERFQQEAPEIASAAAECIGGLDECNDLEDVCDAEIQMPRCVTACEKLLDCGEFDPCEGERTVVVGGDADGEPSDAVPPQQGGGGDAGGAERRRFHLECDDDGNFDREEALVECAFGCTGASFENFDENQEIIDCITATACGQLRETCDPEGEEASGSAMGGGRDSDDNAGGGGGGHGDGAQAEAGGDGPGANAGAGGGGGGGGGSGSRSDGGLCASAPGTTTGGLTQLIGMALRR